MHTQSIGFVAVIQDCCARARGNLGQIFPVQVAVEANEGDEMMKESSVDAPL